MTRKRYRHKKQYRIKKRRSIFRSKIFWFSFFFLILLGSTSYFSVFSSYFQINEIRVSGNQKISLNQVKDLVADGIDKKIIFFFSKSIFLANLKDIDQKIASSIPEIAEVNIKRVFPNCLAVEIKERQAAGTWCQENDCFYIDQEGVIFEKTEEPTPPEVRCEIALSGIYLGQKVIERNCLRAILEVNGFLADEIGIQPKIFTASADGKKLTVLTKEGWNIIFNLNKDVQEQLSDLKLVLEEKIPQNNRARLDYINLRFGNKIYYKYKGSVNPINKD